MMSSDSVAVDSVGGHDLLLCGELDNSQRQEVSVTNHMPLTPNMLTRSGSITGVEHDTSGGIQRRHTELGGGAKADRDASETAA